jgi:hypothetical protein
MLRMKSQLHFWQGDAGTANAIIARELTLRRPQPSRLFSMVSQNGGPKLGWMLDGHWFIQAHDADMGAA